jgi:hypothetical protein
VRKLKRFFYPSPLVLEAAYAIQSSFANSEPAVEWNPLDRREQRTYQLLLKEAAQQSNGESGLESANVPLQSPDCSIFLVLRVNPNKPIQGDRPALDAEKRRSDPVAPECAS